MNGNVNDQSIIIDHDWIVRKNKIYTKRNSI